MALISLVIVGSMLFACEKSVVEVPEKSVVTFSIDWSSVKSTDGVNFASIFLYPDSGTEPIVLRNVSVEKITAEVPAGRYKVIAYNENLTVVQMRNSGSFAQFEAYLAQAPRTDIGKFNSKSSSIETVIPSAEYVHLLTGTASRELLVEDGVPYSFTLRPKTATSTYRFTVRIPTRLDFAAVNTVLSGVASRMGLFEAKPLADDISSVDIPLTAELNARKDTLIARGSIESFGVDPANRNAFSNTLYLRLEPREPDTDVKTNYEIDLTKYFDKYNNLNLDIDVEVVSPDPVGSTEVEFVITVKPWVIDDGGHVDLEPDEE